MSASVIPLVNIPEVVLDIVRECVTQAYLANPSICSSSWIWGNSETYLPLAYFDLDMSNAKYSCDSVFS